MVAFGLASVPVFASCVASARLWHSNRHFDIRARVVANLGWVRPFIVGFAFTVVATNPSHGGVLTEKDVLKVDGIKPLFVSLMGDLVETSKRPDISSGDADCIGLTIRELLQMSDELSSFEYLITIEKDMTDFGENDPVRGIVKFAVDKSNIILASERKRLVQLSDQCSRFSVSVGKMQQALRVIDVTTGILTSIQGRL